MYASGGSSEPQLTEEQRALLEEQQRLQQQLANQEAIRAQQETERKARMQVWMEAALPSSPCDYGTAKRGVQNSVKCLFCCCTTLIIGKKGTHDFSSAAVWY